MQDLPQSKKSEQLYLFLLEFMQQKDLPSGEIKAAKIRDINDKIAKIQDWLEALNWLPKD